MGNERAVRLWPHVEVPRTQQEFSVGLRGTITRAVSPRLSIRYYISTLEVHRAL
jgi:hypothetical protein